MLSRGDDQPGLLPGSHHNRGHSTGIESCVVWTPIPIISWVVPAIGHVGITDSRGTVYDFQGDFTIGREEMLFGEPKQKWAVPVDPTVLDGAVQEMIVNFREFATFFCVRIVTFLLPLVCRGRGCRPHAAAQIGGRGQL
jgi:hypothetical protein